MAKQKQKNNNYQAIQANKFDKIIKENMLPSILYIVNDILKLDIQIDQLSELPEQIQTTLEREPDVLRLVKFKKNTAENFVLHIEFQNQNNDEMHKRMLEYSAILFRKHDLPVLQFVIYIGDDAMNMKTEIQQKDLMFRYNLINIRKEHYEKFLQTDTPEFIMLGILGDFGEEKPVEVLEKILKKIVAISEQDLRYKNKNTKDKFITQLRTLSKVRNFQSLINQLLKKMALIFNIEDDEFYQEGVKAERQKMELIIEQLTQEKEKATQEKEKATQEKEKATQEKIQNIINAYTSGIDINMLSNIFNMEVKQIKKIVRK